MIDEEKIILMSKLTLINNQATMKRDRKITSKYLRDFVYINNLFTQVYIVIAVGAIIIAHIILRIEQGMNVPTTIDEIMYQFVIPYGGSLLLLVIIYTIVSTLVYRKIYKKALEKIQKYDEIFNELKILYAKGEASNENSFKN